MKRRFVVALMIAAGVAASSGGRVAAQSAPPPATEAPGASCPTNDLLLLMDQSASLQTTDPTFQRVDAAEELVDALANTKLPITLSVAGFGESVGAITRFDLPADRDAASTQLQEFRQQPTDRNTDYVLALRAAAANFAAVPGPADCKTLLWFTDGAYDIENAAAASSYTSLTDVDAILDDFGNQVCGPLADTSRLDARLSRQVDKAQMRVSMVDLRTGEDTERQKELRDRSDPVLNRLFSGDQAEPCRINGERISVTNAATLSERFVKEAQRILDQMRADFAAEQKSAGRKKVDCEVLEQGLPVGLVESVGAIADDPTTPVTIALPNGRVPGPTHKFTDGERQQPGDVTVQAASGELDACYVALGGTVDLVGKPHIWSEADSTHIDVTVGGPGSPDRAKLSLGDDIVDLTARIDDGRPTDLKWDSQLRRWGLDVPRLPDGTVSEVDLVVTPTLKQKNLDKLSPLSVSIPVAQEPPVPDVTWIGDTVHEGGGDVSGTLRVSPAAQIGGDVCVAFDESHSALLDANGSELGYLDVDDSEACKPDSKPFDLPATIHIDHTANATATTSFGFRSHYVARNGDQLTEVHGEGETTFELAKPTDTGTFVGIALLLALASGALTAAGLWLGTRHQSRLPNPDSFVMVDVPLATTPDGAMTTSSAGVQMRDLHPVSGSRSKFDLSNGISVRRRTPRNPFANIAAEAVVDRGAVLPVPSLGGERDGSRRRRVPNRFRSLFLVRRSENGENAEGRFVMPRGTTPAQADKAIAQSLVKLNRTSSVQPRSRVSTTPEHPTGDRSEAATPPAADAAVEHEPGSDERPPTPRTPPPPPPRRTR